VAARKSGAASTPTNDKTRLDEGTGIRVERLLVYYTELKVMARTTTCPVNSGSWLVNQQLSFGARG
jgi:hypothetical protein